ncbi:M3 family metallopeptidase [Oligoflexus tunisiensis]|uniref:M3 family metallopeptidase n=1 Tax=Oligoflexus tunisiensis TaxID=708132 RepID=UPI000AEF791D|nr:M3 family metallopeptidase [Oligoflexus tunisiensis]
MFTFSNRLSAGMMALLLTACTSPDGGNKSMTDSALDAKDQKNNTLLAPWTGPHGGLPPFDRVKVSDFKAALETGMEEKRAELKAIAENPEAPNFENTIARLEDSGRALNRVLTVYHIWSGTMSSPEFQAIEKEMASPLAAFEDEIIQNEKLFKRLEAVYQSPALKTLSPEQQRLAWKYYTEWVRAGAKLDAADKQKLSAINQKLAKAFTTFRQNLLADESTFILLENEKDLAGLPDALIKSAAAAAETHGAKGKWAITNTRSSVEPFLTYSSRADLREKVWRAYVNRGDNGDSHDNNQLIPEILQLRAERAKLLGYETHAHWRLENAMARTPEAAMALMQEVWKPAVARVREEVKDMLPLAQREEGRKVIEPWDYRYYAEKVRKQKYDLSENEVKPYFQLDSLREGMFWVAGELLGFAFAPVEGLPVAHPDVRVWEVKDKASGRFIGLWYFDPYAREGKRSGAWMNAYRSQEKFRGDVTTIVSNNSNFIKGAPGEPVLISLSDARTLFHEFGHALHGLSSNVNYPLLAGTAVPRDYVEFPSQLLEEWLLTPQVLSRFALHYKTRKPMPEALVAKIKKASKFNQGFETVEYLASALVDMKFHLKGAQKIDPDAFEKETLAELGMPKEIVMRHRPTQFAHVFASDGYSAGYYSYLWADTLSASAFEAFMEAKGPYDKTVAERLKKHVLSVGNSVDPVEGFRSFRGKAPGSAALMRKRGFPVSKN